MWSAGSAGGDFEAQEARDYRRGHAVGPIIGGAPVCGQLRLRSAAMTFTAAVVPDLRTARLDLIGLDPARDAESLHRMHGSPELGEFGGDRTGSVEETRALLKRTLTENGGWTWVLRLRPVTDAIGTIGIFGDQGIPVRGLSWSLDPAFWGRGLMSEAAPAAVAHLLGPAGITGVEAWIDADNIRSLGVARRARLIERGRLPRTYDDRIGQSIVMARAAAEEAEPDVTEISAALPVRDVPATITLLQQIFGLQIAYAVGDPPVAAKLSLRQWSGSPGVLLRAVTDPSPCSVSMAVVVSTDEVITRADSLGLAVLEQPADTPWFRRVAAFALPDGHRVDVVGPIRPEDRDA